MLEENQLQRLKDSICGIDVFTWGTQHNGTWIGQLNKNDDEENHGSLWLTIPATKENKIFVEKYCDGAKQKIPYRKVQRIIENYDFEVIEVLFSVATNEHSLITLRDFNDDELAARKKNKNHYNSDVEKYFEFEKKPILKGESYISRSLGPILIDLICHDFSRHTPLEIAA